MIPRQVSINILTEELEEATAFCRAEGCGAEITAFAYPAILDSTRLASVIERHREVLVELPHISSHGPFIDLFATSADPQIVDVCRARHEQALRASLSLSAEIYVAHLNSLPMIRNPDYLESFVERAASFWAPLAQLAWDSGATIVLENMWESSPNLQTRVVDEVSHPGLKASFDNGHALVFSDVPADVWIQTLGPRLAHCHLHDNDGETDAHLPIGKGLEVWPPLVAALDGLPREPIVVLESDELERNRGSLSTWRRHGEKGDA